MIRPAHSAAESRLRPHMTECYDEESQYTYDPAYDVPDLSDTEGDNYVASGLLAQTQEDRVNQWREETHQPNRLVPLYIFFSGLFFILFSSFCSFMVVWGQVFGVWGLY